MKIVKSKYCSTTTDNHLLCLLEATSSYCLSDALFLLYIQNMFETWPLMEKYSNKLMNDDA